eukprot:scpid104747/ scgid14876/ 
MGKVWMARVCLLVGCLLVAGGSITFLFWIMNWTTGDDRFALGGLFVILGLIVLLTGARERTQHEGDKPRARPLWATARMRANFLEDRDFPISEFYMYHLTEEPDYDDACDDVLAL